MPSPHFHYGREFPGEVRRVTSALGPVFKQNGSDKGLAAAQYFFWNVLSATYATTRVTSETTNCSVACDLEHHAPPLRATPFFDGSGTPTTNPFPHQVWLPTKSDYESQGAFTTGMALTGQLGGEIVFDTVLDRYAAGVWAGVTATGSGGASIRPSEGAYGSTVIDGNFSDIFEGVFDWDFADYGLTYAEINFTYWDY